MSGAEALVAPSIGYFEPDNPDPLGFERSDCVRPFNSGNVAAHGSRYGAEFGAYQEFAQMVRSVLPGNRIYLSNFDPGESPAAGINGTGASFYSDENNPVVRRR